MAIAALLTAALAGAAAPAAANEYALVRARTLHGQLMSDAQCESALPEARLFWASADFATLDQRAQSAMLYAIMHCAWFMEDGAAAIAAANAAHAIEAEWADFLRMQLGLRFDDPALALAGFEGMTRSMPAEISRMRINYVWGLLRAAAKIDPSGAAELSVHDNLVRYKFEPDTPGAADALRFAHARAMLRQNQAERARARLGRVTDPRNVLAIRVNRLFDPLRGDAAFEAGLDIVAAAEAHLESRRADAAERPRSLAIVMDISEGLRALGRSAEALAVLDAALAEGGEARFDDWADQINWAHNMRAYALYDLFRQEEARAAFGASIAAGEEGEWNVSQVINFASMLEAEGRARDALEVLRTVGRASLYGDMWTASIRVCAGEQVGDAAMIAEQLDFLRANEGENSAALSRALLCVNDIEGAAALFIRRLEDPARRETALLALQRSRTREPDPLTRRVALRQRLEAVRQREDVRAAVDAVGRIEDVPLFSVYWGDL